MASGPIGHRVKTAMLKYPPASWALTMLPIPKVVSGADSLKQIGDVVKGLGVKKPLIVTDEMLAQLGVVQICVDSLTAAGLGAAVYDKVVPNPHEALVEEGLALYKSEKCDGLIAIGGGSPMDTCKMIGACACTGKSLRAFQGAGAVGLAKFPPFVAVPTTAGTGSEATPGAVITMLEQKQKYICVDRQFTPKVAVLDPRILAKLPAPITAATGMDALTHAVESYVSQWRKEKSELYSLRAVEGVFRHLHACYKDGSDMPAREGMLTAAFEAGVALTQASLGYVHAIAHQFGGLYGTPHGVANAMVLVHVLDYYEANGLTDDLANLCIAAGLATRYQTYTDAEKKQLAKKFVAGVRALHSSMDMPTSVKGLTKEDIPKIVQRAIAEAHGEQFLSDVGYPSPLYMTPDDVRKIVVALLPPGEQQAKL